MRLTDDQINAIRQLAREIAGENSRVRVFGSRLDDNAKGDDFDLLLEVPGPVENPALMAARLSARVSRVMHGRKVDVVLSAPNLKRLPIHDVAFEEGQLLWTVNPKAAQRLKFLERVVHKECCHLVATDKRLLTHVSK